MFRYTVPFNLNGVCDFGSQIGADLMAGSNYFYKFSTAENEKRSQDLLLEFAELPREPDFVHPLQRIFDVLPSTEVAEPFEPFQFIDEVEEEPELWINIDELKIEDDLEQEDELEPTESEPEELSDEEPLTESASIVEDLTSALQEGSALPEDLAEKMSTLTEVQNSSLLESIRLFVPAICALCSTLCDVVEQRDQNVLSAQLCSQVLLPKAQEGVLEGPLLASAAQLSISVPHVVVPRLLLPLLDSDLPLASNLISLADSAAFRCAALSSWPEDSATELSEDQLTLLKTLTITWPDDGDVVERLSALFSKLGGSMASSTSYAKVILQLLKAAPKGSLSETAKQNLSNAIAVNKTALRKVLEKTLAGV